VSIFLDTNVLLYSVSSAPADTSKSAVASAMMRRRDCVLSAQVLQEFFHQATRPSRLDPLAVEVAIELVDSWRRFSVIDNTADIMAAGMAICRDSRLSIWDALIVAAAQAARCETLMTEDLSHGQRFGSLLVENPFR